jgi:hypothetical protein
MPDIAMCQNEQCPSRWDCHRYMVLPNAHLQQYTDFQPDEGQDHCASYWPLSKRERLENK